MLILISFQSISEITTCLNLITSQQFKLWFSNLSDRQNEELFLNSNRRGILKQNFLKKHRESDRKDWICTHCRYNNRLIYYNNLPQRVSSKCRCCGSSKDENIQLRITSARFDSFEFELVELDDQIVEEWNSLLQDIKQHPDDNKCHGNDTLIIDSCPIIQKFFLMMKYYHIHIEKRVIDVDDEKKYRIDNMTDLVENLESLSLTKLVDMFEHISTVHRDPQLFEYFIENIGPCDEESVCDNVRRHRDQSDHRRDTERRDENNMDDVERHIVSFFDQWHSFLFHPKYEDNPPSAGTNMPLTEEEQMETDFMPQNLRREYSGKYVDYRFGVWIDYTANSPSFESMKEEMMGNEICSITLDQWQDTLMKALTHLDSDKVRIGQRYMAKASDEQYGVHKGQIMGIDNIVAILIYCNYTDLQRRFTETFCKANDRHNVECDESDEMIIDKHCRNYYWLGRYVKWTHFL